MADMVREAMSFLPEALLFLVILAAGWLAAAAARRLVLALLTRTGFDRAVERGGVGAALARSGHDAGDLVAGLARYAVLLFALQAAFGVWDPNAVSDLLAGVIA